MSAHEIIGRLVVLAFLVGATVVIHGAVTLVAVRYASTRLPIITSRPYFPAPVISMLVFVILLLAAHLSEMLLWGLAIFGLGLSSDFSSAYFFAMETYMTLGYREAVLSDSWRPLTGWLATTGVLMFAWSTALLTSFVKSYHFENVAPSLVI